MSGAKSRLQRLASHFIPGQAAAAAAEEEEYSHRYNYHTLSPTQFLPRAAEIEPDALAIYHRTANGKVLERSYAEMADRARGLAYYLKKHGYKRVGILCPNTPAFLESLFGIAAAGAVSIGANHRLKPTDIAYIFTHSSTDLLLADAELAPLLTPFRTARPAVPILIDTDTDAAPGELAAGSYDAAIAAGLAHDAATGARGWAGLQAQAPDEDGLLALAYTSGTTARPKAVEYTHRGAYLAAVANVVESGLNCGDGLGGGEGLGSDSGSGGEGEGSGEGSGKEGGKEEGSGGKGPGRGRGSDGQRCRYLWTLPLFHATGWTFPWAVTAVRGTHVCLRKIDYALIWRLLRDLRITHFNAAPTVNTLLCAAPEAARLERPVRVTVAASPPSPRLFRDMERLNLLPVHVYGLTETYGPITKGYRVPAWEALGEEERYRRMARQGHGFLTSAPVRVVRVGVLEGGRVVDVARDGKEIGEVVFEGNICARGYYRDPEATRKLWEGGVSHSGDLAVWHPDGAIQILDRSKDIIISGGENISSVALESMLVTHPDILEAGVVAVPDSHWGERPKAFITVKPGHQLKGEDVVDWAKHKSDISKFMVPREVEIVDELPKTSTGKVKKNVLREWAKGGDREEEPK